jgi:hypothetical protein
MNVEALGPEDKIETFTDIESHAPAVRRTTFVSFGPILRSREGATVLQIKLIAIEGPRGKRDVFEVCYSPMTRFDPGDMMKACARAVAFVGSAKSVALEDMYHSDFEALAKEVV